MGDAAQIDNDGLDTVTLALNLGLDLLHLVAVELVGDVLCVLLVSSQRMNKDVSHYPTNVDGSHDERCVLDSGCFCFEDLLNVATE